MKRTITNATLETLLEANLAFEKEDFKNKVNSLLYQHDIELHEKTIQDILKNLQNNNYIEIEDGQIIKTNKSILNPNSKQRKLFETITEDLKSDFDLQYIKQQYIKQLLKQENLKPHLYHLAEKSFNALEQDQNFKTEKASSMHF